MNAFLRRQRWSLGTAALAAVLGAAVAVPACSSDGGSSFLPEDAGVDVKMQVEAGPLDGLQSITVAPSAANLVAGDAPTKQAFTAQGKFADGTSRDVTALVVWNATPSTLLFANGPIAAPVGAVGGDGSMNAVSGSLTGSAPVHVKLVESVYTTGAPAGSDARFVGADDATLAPDVIYPLDGVLVPPNLQAMELQWKPAAGTTLFDAHFQGAAMDLHVYTACNALGATGGCGLVPDAATWTAIVHTLQGGDPVELTLRAVGATAGKVGTSKKLMVQFAATDVKGGLYYFNTRSQNLPDGGVEKPGIYRYDFAKGEVGPFFTQQACAGCHALSKDGTKMLAPICTDARGCGRPLQLAVVDVATKTFVTPPMPVGDSDTQSWSPDNKFYVTTPTCGTISPTGNNSCATDSGGVIQLIDAATNTLVGKVPTGAGALFPSFSNDGKRIVYARGNPYNGPLGLQKASLFTIDFTSAPTPTWGVEKPLLQSGGENNYYPSFSPDDAWVVYSQSHCDAGDAASVCDTYDDPTAKVFVASAGAGGGAPIDLARANGAGRLDNSWPKWSPFKGAYKGGDIFWITFSTFRDYGLRTYDAAGNPTRVRQLWLVGFDVARAKAGKDPSFAPVWLPFQETTTSNHIGQWTEKVVGSIH